MIQWYVLGALSIAGVAVLSVTSVSSIGLKARTSFDMENSRRLSEVVREMQARVEMLPADIAPPGTGWRPARWPPGAPSLPVGMPGGTGKGYGYLLPADFTGPRVSVSGRPIVYCPMGPDGGSTSAELRVTIPEPSGSGYDVFVGGDRVVGGGRSLAGGTDPEILGLVIAPLRSDSSPRCQDVVFSGGTFSVPDGLVQPIRRSAEMAVSGARAWQDVTIHVATTGVASRTGFNPSEPTTLMSALSWWQANRPDSARIVVAGGTYNVAHGAFDFGESMQRPSGTRRSLAIVARQGENVEIVQATHPTLGTGWFRSDASLLVRGINFGRVTRFMVGRGHDLYMDHVAVGGVHVAGGNASVHAASILPVPGDIPVVVQGGRFNMSWGTVRCQGDGCLNMLVESHGTVRIHAGINRFGDGDGGAGPPSAGIRIRTGGTVAVGPGVSLFAETSLLQAPVGGDSAGAAALFVVEDGQLVLNQALVVPQVVVPRMIYAGSGARIGLFDADIAPPSSTPPGAGFLIGIRDGGLLNFVGYSNLGRPMRALSSCWEGLPGSLMSQVPNSSGVGGRPPAPMFRPVDFAAERDDAGVTDAPLPRFGPLPAGTLGAAQVDEYIRLQRLADVNNFVIRMQVMNRLVCQTP